MAQSQRDRSPAPAPVSRRVDESSPPWVGLIVTVASALAAGATGHVVLGTPGWVAVGIVAVLGGAVTLLFVKGPSASHGTAAPASRKAIARGGAPRSVDPASQEDRLGGDDIARNRSCSRRRLHGAASDPSGGARCRHSGMGVSRIAIDEAELLAPTADAFRAVGRRRRRAAGLRSSARRGCTGSAR
jgi:hypothetical protein